MITLTAFQEDSGKRKLFGRKVIQSHEIGNYGFIETQGEDLRKAFHIYITGESTSYSASTLDEALIVAVALKHDGRNSQAAHYFMRMIGMKDAQ